MAKSKKLNLVDISNKIAATSEGLSSQDASKEAEVLRQRAQVSARALDRIYDRVGQDTRKLNPERVVELAESIQALGLIVPISVDSRGHLLAGGHRLAACRLIAGRPDDDHANAVLRRVPAIQRDRLSARIRSLCELGYGAFDPNAVPVRTFDFQAKHDAQKAMLIEISENTQRHDYTSAEVRELYHRLIDAGYVDVKGRPNAGQRPVKPALAIILGKNLRTVRRILRDQELQKEIRENSPFLQREHNALTRLRKAAKSITKTSFKTENDELEAILKDAARLEKRLAALLDPPVSSPQCLDQSQCESEAVSPL